MKNIGLDNIIPQIFLSRTDIRSEVWRRHLTLERGLTYLVEAGSGTGKSSLCSFITGHRHDYDGRILYDGRDGRSLSTDDWVNLRRSHLSMLFQELRLFTELTAMENIEIKNSLTRHTSRQQIVRWLEALGIADKQNTPVRFMSFGQQQRVAMVRALVQPFDFLFVDEPISHLDDENAKVMASIMIEEVHRQGAAVVVTSIGKHMQLPYDKTLRL